MHLIGRTYLVLLLVMIFWPLSAQVEGWQASKETVEKLSKSRSEFNFYEEKVPSYTLPAILTASNGKIISTKEDWMKIRRPELLELFRTNV